MKKTCITLSILVLAAMAIFMSLPATSIASAPKTNLEADAMKLADRVLGSDKAPITIIEYASFSCSHCSTFYADVMPELTKKYIDTGKVRFIYRDFPSNRYDLMAGAIAQCVPKEQYYPYVKTLFAQAQTWLTSPKPENTLIQYASLAGLDPEKAKKCSKDTKMLDALVARRTEAITKYAVKATPTFIINDHEDKITGALPFEEFSAKLDKILAKK